MKDLPIALQLYTVRDDVAEDYIGTLKKVAEIGYAGVELGGTGDMTPAEFKQVLADLGLKPAGQHIGLDQLETQLDRVIDDNLAIGNSFIVCPWLPEDRRQDAEGWKKTGELFDKIGAQCREQGLTFCYHNHSFEFARFDGEYGLDLLYGATDPELVKAELDTYWVQHGGESPAEYLRKYADRTPLIHLKDMLPDEAKTFAEVGEGILDWDAIFAEAEADAAVWGIVEQDRCQRPPLESARLSLENLKKMGRA